MTNEHHLLGIEEVLIAIVPILIVLTLSEDLLLILITLFHRILKPHVELIVLNQFFEHLQVLLTQYTISPGFTKDKTIYYSNNLQFLFDPCGEKDRRGFFLLSLGLIRLASLVDNLMFTFASFLMLKKSLSTSSTDKTIELLFVTLVEVGLFEIFGVERPGPFPNIVLLRLSLGYLPESYLLIFSNL